MDWRRVLWMLLGNNAVQSSNEFFQTNTFAFFKTVFFRFQIRIFAIFPKSKMCFWRAKIK